MARASGSVAGWALTTSVMEPPPPGLTTLQRAVRERQSQALNSAEHIRGGVARASARGDDVGLPRMTQTVAASSDVDARREQSWVFFNGEIVRYADAKVGLLTHGLNYGTGVFEGIRAYWNQEREQLLVLRMPEHYERMHRNTRVVQMNIRWGVAELCAITNDLLRRNGYR